LSDGAALFESATAFKEAVTDHALAKKEKNDRQENCKQQFSDSERG